VASKEAYAIACIELFSRIWAELDLLADSGQVSAQPAAALWADARGEILRLELILLIESCDSARWRMLLSAPQRRALASGLQDLLHALATSPEEQLRHVLAVAQDSLLDAVLGHLRELLESARAPGPAQGSIVVPVGAADAMAGPSHFRTDVSAIDWLLAEAGLREYSGGPDLDARHEAPG
jgi:hypothetical protein